MLRRRCKLASFYPQVAPSSVGIVDVPSEARKATLSEFSKTGDIRSSRLSAVLDFAWAPLTSGAARLLMVVLAKNSSVRGLRLCGTRLGEASLVAAACFMLMHNSCLEELDFAQCFISKEGAMAMVEALQPPATSALRLWSLRGNLLGNAGTSLVRRSVSGQTLKVDLTLNGNDNDSSEECWDSWQLLERHSRQALCGYLECVEIPHDAVTTSGAASPVGARKLIFLTTAQADAIAGSQAALQTTLCALGAEGAKVFVNLLRSEFSDDDALLNKHRASMLDSLCVRASQTPD